MKDVLKALGVSEAVAGYGLDRLSTATEADLVAGGIKRREAKRVLAAVELGRQVLHAPIPYRQFIRTSTDVAKATEDMTLLDVEKVVVLGLDARGRLKLLETVSQGGIDGSMVDPRVLLRTLLKGGAATCIMVHNHPSGDPMPSPEDKRLTERVKEACKAVGIRFMDHVIVAKDGWFSFNDAGQM